MERTWLKLIGFYLAFHKQSGNICHTLISRPQLCVIGQLTSRQQIRIYKTNTFIHQLMSISQLQHLIMHSFNAYTQITQQANHLFSVLQITLSHLTQNYRMTTHMPRLQQRNQCSITSTQMVNPKRSIHQCHHVLSVGGKSLWRHTGADNLGSVPPNRAKRFALSHSIKAFKLSCKTVDFSFIPISSVALANKVSSTFRIVRIAKPQTHQNKHHCMPILMHALQISFINESNL